MKNTNEKVLLDLIKENYEKIKPKTCNEFFKLRDKKIPCRQTLQKLFGMTYNEILIKAGISDERLNVVKRNSKYCIDTLMEARNRLGYVPSESKFISLGYSTTPIKRIFGSYENAAKIIDPEYKANIKYESIDMSKEELLNMYIEYSKKIGMPASSCDILYSNELPSINAFKNRFGRMEFLKKEAGFESEKPRNLKYEKEDVVKNLIAAYLVKGRRLTVKEIVQEQSIPSYNTILYNFKTTKISKVWEEIEGYISSMNKNWVQ